MINFFCTTGGLCIYCVFTVYSCPRCLFPAVPDVEVKGERDVYFLLVQGSDDVGSGACRVRLMHSYCQLNGAAAMATIFGLLREKPLSSGILCDLGFVCIFAFTFVTVKILLSFKVSQLLSFFQMFSETFGVWSFSKTTR